MSSSKRPPRRMGSYEVGFGRPPVATRFKPGNRGNPRGRPKRKKTVNELLEEALNEKVRMLVNGRQKTMTKQQVILHNLVNGAARGDHKAIQTLFSLKARYQDSAATVINPAELDANDRQIIEDFLANRTSDASTGEPPAAEGDPNSEGPDDQSDEGDPSG